MIYAKINPAATKVEQITPFSIKTLTADTMTAIARPYILGSDKTRFEVKYGIVTLNENNIVTKFENILSSECILTSNQLSDWGVDDSLVLTRIAENFGTSVTEILSGNTKNMF